VNTGVRGGWDTDALATTEERRASVLVWNYRDEDKAVPGTPVSVTVKGIPAGVRRVLVENYRIDETHSNAYTAWQKIGSPQQPTTEQYQKLLSEQGAAAADFSQVGGCVR
jgi:xylan 1,4-beta-xylosidase